MRIRAREAHFDVRLGVNSLTSVGSTGRIAVKVINHLGDEVMKVFRV